MYYSALSLAIAEMLMKGTGDVSLDRARSEHNHHGLSFRLSVPKGNLPDLAISASSLRAVPSIKQVGGEGPAIRFGTFELWHRNAREYPVTGYGIVNDLTQGLTHKTFKIMLTASDERMPLLPESGITLLDCAKHIPAVGTTLARYGLEPSTVPAICGETGNGNDNVMSIMIQPTSNARRDTFISNIRIYPRLIPNYEYREFSTGGEIKYKPDPACEFYDNVFKGSTTSFPSGVASDSYRYNFFTELTPLNGFGMYYVALFILSNYARYYPDFWMKDIEGSSPLSILADELLESAASMLPLLTYSELARIYYVAEGVPVAF
jgi:hypothetical protein